MKPRLFLGFDSLRAGNGGICRVARLVSRVVSEEVQAGKMHADGIVLQDEEIVPPEGVPIRSVRKSRASFAARVSAAKFGHTHFIYDCGGMSRAHAVLPFPGRPFLSFLLGIEVWKETQHPAQVAALLKAGRLMAISDFTKAKAVENNAGFSAARTCWITTDTDAPPLLVPRSSKGPRVLILSRLDEVSYKGHNELILAWPEVRKAVPDAILTIAGSGPGLKRLQQLVAERGLPEGAVEFAGFVPEDRIDELWASTAVFAMPSRGEGFGLVYVEAMRWGIPVIASVHDAGREVNVHGETGYNVDLDKPGELVAKLVALLRDDALAVTMGRNGFERWKLHFRFSSFRERFRPVLHDFLGI